MINFEKIKTDVKHLLSEKSGHDFEHIERVLNNALEIARTEGGNIEIVTLGALLHDCDDYKLFGQESADNLTNTKKILKDAHVDEEIQKSVFDIVGNMGYSNSMKGIRPNTLEGHIVSDADMLDAMGATMVTRLAFICGGLNIKIFDKTLFPMLNMTQEEYKSQQSSVKNTFNFINHTFEKNLKLRDLMLTKAGKIEATKRREFMVFFLRQFFIEQRAHEWLAFLDKYEKENN